MATPELIHRIHCRLATCAEEVRDFQVAKGEAPAPLVDLLRNSDGDGILRQWGEAMGRSCGVMAGEYREPYILAAGQAFSWSSAFAAATGATWENLGFTALLDSATSARLDDPRQLEVQATRLVDLGAAQVKAVKPLLLWCMADRIYRRMTPRERQWTIEDILESILAEFRKSWYMLPILRDIHR